MPPAGSFLFRQEAPQECGLRGRCRRSHFSKVRLPPAIDLFPFAARSTTPLKNPPGLKTNRVCTMASRINPPFSVAWYVTAFTERNALREIYPEGGDTYYFGIIDCPWSFGLHCQYCVSRAVFARQKEVSRLSAADGSRFEN